MERERLTEIQKEMERILGDGWDIQSVTVNKTGGKKEGLSCRYREEPFSVTVYPEGCQMMLGENASVREMGEYLASIIQDNRQPPIEITREVQNFRQGLYIQMVNADINQDMLKDAVYYQTEDMAAVARCRVGDDGENIYSFLVTKENLPEFQMTESEVMERAYRNTASQKFTLKNMEEMMLELIPQEMLSPEDMEAFKQMVRENSSPLYVLTNEKKLDGANVLVCPEALHQVYEKLGEPYYVLPSSTHEVLLIKESEGLDADAMRKMVSEVNTSTVSAEDLLSFQIFRYDGRKLSAVKEENQAISKAAEMAEKHGFKIIH